MSNKYEKRLGLLHKAKSNIKTYASNSGISCFPYTQSPTAHKGLFREGDTGLSKLRLEVPGGASGQRVFGRAIGSSKIAICTALYRDQAEAGQSGNLCEISRTQK